MRRLSKSRSRPQPRRLAVARRLEVVQLEDRLPPGDMFGLFAGAADGSSLLNNHPVAVAPDCASCLGESSFSKTDTSIFSNPLAHTQEIPSYLLTGTVKESSGTGIAPAPVNRAGNPFEFGDEDPKSTPSDRLLQALLNAQNEQLLGLFRRDFGPAIGELPLGVPGSAPASTPVSPSPAPAANGQEPLDQPTLEGLAGQTPGQGRSPGTQSAGRGKGADPDDPDVFVPGIIAFSSSGPAINITLVADTDRDGVVTDADLPGRADWTNTLGAIYAVNFDDDNSNGQPDAVSFNDAGQPFNENFVIENAADAQDLAPLVIRALGPNFNPATMQVVLSVASLQDAQSIHVFPSLTPGTTSILGSLGTRIGLPAAATSVDITAYVSATSDATFGVEGLLFRNTNPTPALTFDGYIDFTLSVYQNSTLLGSDNVRMKVAPWIMNVHTQASERIYAANAGASNASTLFNASADPGYFGVSNSGQLFTYTQSGINNNQWTQDHGEFGYTERPGGPRQQIFFRLPYFRQTGTPQPTWPQALLAPDVGIFQIGLNLGAGAGDYGGNVEALTPTAAYPLGRTILGSTGSNTLFTFLQSQEVQPTFQIPTNWLIVSHVDEIVLATSNPNEYVIADPSDAYARLNAIPVEERGGAVFFATGQTPQTGTVTAASTPTRIFTGVDHTGQTWQYLRLYDSSASGSNSAGQVARIAPGGLGNGYIDIDLVWNTSSKVIDPVTTNPSAMRWMLSAPAPTSGSWFATPQAGDKFVLVDGTRFWSSGGQTPAIITVQEVLADNELHALNTIDIQNTINGIRTTLDNAAGGPGTLTFIRVPVLYVGRRLGFATNRSAAAFTAGLQNFQPLGAEQYFPRQFGPRTTTGTYTGQISFGTNDGDENPFNFTVTGTVGPVSVAQYRDNGDIGFSATAGWVSDSGGYQGDIHYAEAGTGSETADWTFTGLQPGQYRISATWTADPNRATNAPYAITDGTSNLGTVLVNQELAPGSFSENGTLWQNLGTYTLGNGTLRVRLTNAANEYVIADAIRIERLAPELQVLDGTTDIPDNNGLVNVGATPVGTPLNRTLTVRNVGTANLTLTNSISLPAGYTLVSGFGATTLAPGAQTTFTVQLASTVAGNYSGRLSFRSNDYDEDPYNITLTGTVGTVPSYRILDNGEPGFSVTPGWTLLDDTTFGVFQGLQGDVHFAEAGNGFQAATWTFTNLAPGTYRVSTTWFPHANRATNAPYTVFNGTTSGTSLGTVLINQEVLPNDFRDAGIDWKDLGTFTITGTTLTVRLTNAANEYVIADAVRIERIGFVGRTLDNGETGFSVTPGWTLLDDTTFGVFQGLQGDVHFAAAGTGSETATWTFTGLAAGTYRVSTTWFPHANRATNAPYSVYNGSALPANLLGTVPINQELTPNDFRDAGIDWKDLGTFTITGTTLTVRLTNAANEYVIADAVRIERVGTGTVSDIQVLDGATDIPDNNGLVNFGSTTAGAPLTRTFTVRNVGTANLTLTGSIVVPAGYTLVSGFGSTTLAPGAQTTFTVRLEAAPVDILEYAARTQFSAPRFVDVWNLYHRLLGELHCGTVVRRTPFAFNWWSNQP